MILRDTGPVINGFFVTGNAQFPVYLMDGPQPVLFDGGVTAAGILYEHDIRSILGSAEPALLFLTHAHWDHCGAVGRLKSAFPH